MSECFKVFYVKLYVHSLVDKLKLRYNFSFDIFLITPRKSYDSWFVS